MSYENERTIESLPWARDFARTCTAKLPGHLDHGDLQSAGVLGYLRAASRYDASKGASFRGYCARRIRGAVLDELRRWDWAPRSVHKKNRDLFCVTSDLTAMLEWEPRDVELAAALGLKKTELAAFQTQAQLRQLVSLEEMTDHGQGEEGASLIERLADPHTARPDAALLSSEDRRTMLRCLGCLSKTQVTVIVLHYLQNVPLRDVAEVLAVTPARVSQLHRQALGRLKQAWRRAQKLSPVIPTGAEVLRTAVSFWRSFTALRRSEAKWRNRPAKARERVPIPRLRSE